MARPAAPLILPPPDAPDVDFRRLIHEVMTADGWTVGRLANVSGVDKGTIWRWLRGRRDIKQSTVCKILQTLGVRIQ